MFLKYTFFNVFYFLLSGLCFSAIFPSYEYLQMFIVPFETICMIMMGGEWININSIPSYLSWLKYSSAFFYCFEAVSIIVWSDYKQIGIFILNTLNDFSLCLVFSDCSSNSTRYCYSSGTEYLSSVGYHIEKVYVLNDIMYITILSVIFCIVGYIGILRTKSRFISY